MAKTNYTKVEEALAEGMRKIEKEKLLTATDKNAGVKKEKPLEAKKNVDPVLLRRLTKIDSDLQLLHKEGNDPYVQMQIDPEEIKKFLNDPSSLTDQDWEKVKTIKDKITNFKFLLERGESSPSEEDFIKEQRKDQKTKRFNINKKWIPLQ